MNQMYRIMLQRKGAREVETLNFPPSVGKATNGAFYQMRAAREIVRALRPTCENVCLEVKVSETEWTEVEVS